MTTQQSLITDQLTMTAQTITFEKIGYPRQEIKVGGTLWGYCSKCMTQTEKLYTGYSTICLGCHPEKRPEEEKKNG